MRLPFNGSYNVTQRFNDECCRASYAKFGMQGHNGIDYGMPTNSPVTAAHGGKVVTGYEANGYGNYVFITGEGYESVYGHLNRVTVSNGQVVNAGDQIGLSGSTGNSTGPHLHFGVRPIGYNRNNGFLGYIDPQPLFNGQGGSMATKVTKETLRMIHSEMEGWPYKEVHAGKFDAQFWASWGGQDLEACMWEKWNKNEPYRNTREEALDYWRNKKKSVEDQVKSQQDQISKQAAEITSLKAQLAEAGKQPVVTEDSILIDETVKQAKKWWQRINISWGKK